MSIGTIDGNSLTTNNLGEWYQIEMSSYVLELGRTYSLVFRAPNGNDWNFVGLMEESYDNLYDNGVGYYSSIDSGNTWERQTIFDPADYLFEIWGK